MHRFPMETIAQSQELHEARPSQQAEASSLSAHFELNIDNFEICSMELREPHDQTQATRSQSFPESRQPFAAHHPIEAQLIERRQGTMVQQHEGRDQTGPSHQRDVSSHSDHQASSADHAEAVFPQERTWTTQQLHQLADEIVQIKHFDHKTFHQSLTPESKAICEQLNRKGEHRKSLNDQEWEDIQKRLQCYDVNDKYKKYRYFYGRSEQERKHIKGYNALVNMRSQQQGFKNRYEKINALAQQQGFKSQHEKMNALAQLQGFKSRYERHYKKPRPDDAPEPS